MTCLFACSTLHRMDKCFSAFKCTVSCLFKSGIQAIARKQRNRQAGSPYFLKLPVKNTGGAITHDTDVTRTGVNVQKQHAMKLLVDANADTWAQHRVLASSVLGQW